MKTLHPTHSGCRPSASWRLLLLLSGLVLALVSVSLQAQETPAIAGNWMVNSSLSDSTDRQVEEALKAAGERVQRRWFSLQKDRYRGGPPEQELYDRISYDPVLQIELEGPDYRLTYADDYIRDVHTDNRSRSVSLTGLEELEDFAVAQWMNGKLLIEAQPRDGGYTEEIYELIDGGARLRVSMIIKPGSFRVPIQLTRVYDRQ